MIALEHGRSILLGSQAFIIGEEDHEIAWAETHVRRDPDIRWILGNFVEADRANSNGHIFPLADLQAYSLATIPNKPLNMLHRPHRNVGAYAAAQLIEPDSERAAAGDHPRVEALSAFWRSIFPEEAHLVEAAHKEGSLFYSMECMPESLSCPSCTNTYAYDGPMSASYCSHLQASRIAPKVLNKPHFNGGALIIPPVRPGWRHADITELAGLIESNLEEAENVYNAIAGEFNHLSPREWEVMMATVLALTQDGNGDDPTPAGYFTQHQFVPDLNGLCIVCVQPEDVHNRILQPGGPDADEVLEQAAFALLAAKYSPDQIKQFIKEGKALPNGGFPIDDVEDVKNAIRAIGRAGNAAEAKTHIKKSAARLGVSELIPPNWN